MRFSLKICTTAPHTSPPPQNKTGTVCTMPAMPVIYLRLFPCSRLKTRILTELGRTVQCSERLYSERISRISRQSLHGKPECCVILGGSDSRPLAASVDLNDISCSLIILVPRKLNRTCCSAGRSERCYLRYSRLSRKPCILAVYRLTCRSFVGSYPERICGIRLQSVYSICNRCVTARLCNLPPLSGIYQNRCSDKFLLCRLPSWPG